MTRYEDFLAAKTVSVAPAGLAEVPPLNGSLFDYQRAVTDFLLRCGRGAAFLDTGLGKTLIQLDWSRVVAEETRCPVLVLAPLAVAGQTVREGRKFGIPAQVVGCQGEVRPGINVTNYEKLQHFRPEAFGGVVLDESSILKSFAGATTRKLIAAFAATPYRLACSATPAPNDHTELGQHSDFLGVMPSPEMLSRWFITDQSAMGRYRLKGHAVQAFWRWVASWGRCLSRPSDLGFSDEGFTLPPLTFTRHVVSPAERRTQVGLFDVPETSATAIHKAKRDSAPARAAAIADLVKADPGEPWIVWCDTDFEADELKARIDGAVEVRGSMPAHLKERRLLDFTEGRLRVLVTKPSIAGFGLNWQHCARVAFVGLSYSYETYYQAVRRCWRFGQRRPVQVHVALAESERATVDAVHRKAAEHDRMKAEMVAAMREAGQAEGLRLPYRPAVPLQLPDWMAA